MHHTEWGRRVKGGRGGGRGVRDGTCIWLMVLQACCLMLLSSLTAGVSLKQCGSMAISEGSTPICKTYCVKMDLHYVGGTRKLRIAFLT